MILIIRNNLNELEKVETFTLYNPSCLYNEQNILVGKETYENEWVGKNALYSKKKGKKSKIKNLRNIQKGTFFYDKNRKLFSIEDIEIIRKCEDFDFDILELL